MSRTHPETPHGTPRLRVEGRRFSQLIALLGLLVTAACASSSDALPEGPGVELAPVRLGLRLTPGETFLQEITTEEDAIRKLQGQEQRTRSESALGIRFAIQDVDPTSGHALIDMTFAHARVTMRGGPLEMSYDSREDGPPPPLALGGLDAVVGLGCQITLDTSARIVEIAGIEEMIAAAMERVPEGPLKENTVDSLKAQFGPQGIRDRLEGFLVSYPRSPVAPGRRWSTVTTATYAVPVRFENDWSLETNTNPWILSLSSTLSTAPDAPATDIGGVTARHDLTGTQEATFELDVETGWIRASQHTIMTEGRWRVTTPQPFTFPESRQTTIRLVTLPDPTE